MVNFPPNRKIKVRGIRTSYRKENLWELPRTTDQLGGVAPRVLSVEHNNDGGADCNHIEAFDLTRSWEGDAFTRALTKLLLDSSGVSPYLKPYLAAICINGGKMCPG